MWIFNDFEVQIANGGSRRFGNGQVRRGAPPRDRRVREGFAGFADQSRSVPAEIGEENHAAVVPRFVLRFPLNVETLRRGREASASIPESSIAAVSESSAVSKSRAVRRRSPVCSSRRRIPRRRRHEKQLLRREEYEASVQRAAPDLHSLISCRKASEEK